MNRRQVVVGTVLLLLLLVLPVAVLAFWKPVRVLLPERLGLECSEDGVCTDDSTRRGEATGLYEEALAYVGSAIAPFESAPRVLFCATDRCARAFGLGKRSAITVGTLGIVIGPRAWKPHYVRHEMIHHLQNERLGSVNVWRGPEWFIEGMAYVLSEDPRAVLSEPFQAHRARFRSWYAGVGRERLWDEARTL